jgi:hypothetical protein
MHVIFLAPHFPAAQFEFVRGLKNVGARVTGIGEGSAEGLPRVVRELLDGYESVSNVCDDDQVLAAVRRIQRKGPWVHRFESTIESHMYTAARVREAAGIPGLTYRTVELCRDKFVMKSFLREHGIPCAKNAAVKNAAEAVAFIQEVGYPVILKPRDGAGAHATYKIEDAGDLARAIAEIGLDKRELPFTMEEFNQGHEGFWDTLTIGGQVVFEFVSHYYPNVLPAMRNPDIPAYVMATNRVDAGGYDELKSMGRDVIRALGIGTAATHMEWFFGPKGLRFSEIGARPPGVSFWDVYSAANEIDLYTEWARAVCWGDVHRHPTRRYAGCLLSIRPTAQGTVKGYSGVDEVMSRFGPAIVKMHLPPPGSRTQTVDAGYLANAWMMLRHPDYDTLRDIVDDVGRTLKMWAG